ncbi:MAG TPA: right-handed parallel beta-helix repeat-containing protein [Bryobacteraceae bacterium]|nr:right-handed parallel beta-helix repeat-containing protein [Bryobacteraceae bacterium]
MRWLVAVLLALPQAAPRATVLPAGVVELHEEMSVSGEVRGAPAGTVLRMAPDFRGRAAIVVTGPAHLRDFTIEGNGEIRAGLPPWNVPFAKFTRGNGILVEGIEGVTVEHVNIRRVGGFGILVSRAQKITIESAAVTDCGSRNEAGKNNTTGGILLEEGTADFRVTACTLRGILGNGVWTHSLYTSPRNGPGAIEDNRFETIGRDAVQAGHAVRVTVRGNTGAAIGYPKDAVDATPAALDTAGNVEGSTYAKNRFENINGKCIDLDGFHDGEVSENSCKDVGGYGIVLNNTNPDMQSRNIRLTDNTLENVLYGGIFVIGTGHAVARNHLRNLNTSHCDGCGYVPDEPDMLDSGIYLGRKAERPAPARGNTVEDNEISGYKMKSRCVGRAPGIAADWNTVRANVCRE